MMLHMMKSKIHRATITQAELNYAGSITLDPALMEQADILPFEQVQVLNVNTGARFETYAIEGERGSGVVCLNGPAARLGQVGDLVIILTYAWMDAEDAQTHTAKTVHVDAQNTVTTIDHAHEPN
ncbi:MAG TPA: aspartate 1-decarboxylase [Candidatus Hydrogenedentes bacterium]|nr:aspartate 1-decarboxylase [Candidatus Hydrogenedentota bacterium]